MSLKSVKNKIKSIDKTRQVTKAMEAVSAVKMRKAQALALGTRPYALSAFKVLRSVAGAIDLVRHPLLAHPTSSRACVVIISADKGLAGSYGANLLKGVYQFIAREGVRKEDLDLVIVGKKAREHFEKRGYTIIASVDHWSDRVTFDDIRPIAMKIREDFTAGTWGRVFVVGTHFRSTLRQEVRSRLILPLSLPSVEEAIRGIVPESGRYAELAAGTENMGAPSPAVSFDPSVESVASALLPHLFNIQIYHAVLEANASEHSARMIAMKNASDNARDISRALKLSFNKVRQSAITREVSEIVGGMEAMKVRE